MNDQNVKFPKIGTKNWWAVRDLFRRRVPAVVTPSYLATALSMSQRSAMSNIIGPFKKIGIIDDEGKPTDLAYEWRDDSKYPEVCRKIIDNQYPQELKDLYHSPDQDLSGLKDWFMHSARVGEPAAKMLSAFYQLLLTADATKQQDAITKHDKKPKRKPTAKKQPIAPKDESTKELKGAKADLPSEKSKIDVSQKPQLHVNIQLHISPETTPEQIDKIFESMANHMRNL